MKKNTETLLHARKEDGIEVNAEKLCHIFMSRHQNKEQNQYIKAAINALKTWQSPHIWEQC